MTTQPLDTRGRLYAQAAQFSAELEALETARVDQMLGAWTDAYWGVRQEMDTFLAKVAAAKAAGQPVSPAWAYQQQRLKNVLDAAKAQMALYAAHASREVVAAQQAAIDAGVAHAEALARTAVAEGLPGLAVDMARINPATLRAGVGFLADGTVLANHLAATMPADAADAVRDALIRGLAMGRSQDWMIREATKALGLTHGRATTILRTESLRAYRQASRAEYLANSDVLGGWVWDAHLDARTCLACALMHGTEHPLDSTLDGHPRCRCAMVPRTRTWEELGAGPGLPDTRPPVRPGKAWLEAQTPEVQRAMMGRAKYDAWTAGTITLDDMVARSYSPAWGTMRTERSLRAIRDGRDANWMDAPEAPPSPPDPFAGMSDDDVRARISSGAVADRRAAQAEMVRRKNAAVAQAQQERQAILDRYAGDGTTWTAVQEFPDTYQRGRHTAIVRHALKDLDGFLADTAAALDKMPSDLRPITFLVPKRGTDRMFRDSPTGMTGGYVTQGMDFVNINPTVADGYDLDAAQRTAQFMPGSGGVTVRQWTIAHELGHIMDHGHDHTDDARPAGAVWRKNKAGLSRYGQTHRAEGYAEAWAQWTVGGPGSDPVADAYAREYGWPPPK